VRVSVICFGNTELTPVLNDDAVAAIYADLTAGAIESGADVTQAKSLANSCGICFIGTQKSGSFDIAGELARQWLKETNPHGKPNSDVLRPWANGMDITRRPSDTWIIDFGTEMKKQDACFYEQPFSHLQTHVKIKRNDSRETIAAKWWLHTRPRPDMRQALNGLSRYICSPRVAKHRLFKWLNKAILPDTRLVVVARSDDMTFGILSSRIHQIWSLATCSWHGIGNDPTYNANSCFETFPFPIGLTPADTGGAIETLASGAIIPTVAAEYQTHAKAIAEAAFKLNQLREEWLNPPEWIERQPEVVAGYPDRIIPKPEYATQLKQRTLTNLYNERPEWLADAHHQLNLAVAAAYGWKDDATELNEAEILRRLLALNVARINFAIPENDAHDA
jgi:hypothetical protein